MPGGRPRGQPCRVCRCSGVMPEGEDKYGDVGLEPVVGHTDQGECTPRPSPGRQTLPMKREHPAEPVVCSSQTRLPPTGTASGPSTSAGGSTRMYATCQGPSPSSRPTLHFPCPFGSFSPFPPHVPPPYTPLWLCLSADGASRSSRLFFPPPPRHTHRHRLIHSHPHPPFNFDLSENLSLPISPSSYSGARLRALQARRRLDQVPPAIGYVLHAVQRRRQG